MRDAGLRADSRAHLLAALILAAFAALVVVTSIIAFGPGSLTDTDGKFFVVMAERLPDVASGDIGITTYRMSRPLLPALAWVAGAGRAEAMLAATTAVYLAAFAGLGWATSKLTHAAAPPWRLLCAPALWLTLPNLVAEPVAVLLVLMAFMGGGVRGPLAGALAMLAKESAAVALLPLGLRALARRRWGEALGWLAAALPLGAWWVALRAWTGRWPWEDAPVGGGVTLPFAGMIEAFPEQVALARTDGAGALAWVIVSMVVALGTLAVALRGWRRDRAQLLWAAAAASALLVLSGGVDTWGNPGESLRLLLPAQVLVLVAMRAPRDAPAAR